MVAVLKRVSAIWLLLVLAACSRSEINYETYVQVSNTDSSDAKHVLVLAKNPQSLIGEPDSSLATFTLRDKETKREIKGNKHFPDNRYQFDVALDQGVLKIQITVRHGEVIVFQSNQAFNGSTVPEKVL